MATGTIVRVWQDGVKAYAAVRVTESWGSTEYIGAVPLGDIPGGATNAQKKTILEPRCGPSARGRSRRWRRPSKPSAA